MPTDEELTPAIQAEEAQPASETTVMVEEAVAEVEDPAPEAANEIEPAEADAPDPVPTEPEEPESGAPEAEPLEPATAIVATPEPASELDPISTPEPELPLEAEPTIPLPAAKAEPSDADLFEAAMSALDSDEAGTSAEPSYKRLSRGDRVEATVIQVDRDRVFVDLGTKSEGIVPLGELTEDPINHASEHVKVGDRIHVVVVKPEGAEGNPIVSKKRADFENAWIRIEEAFNEGTVFNAPVVDRVKGGLVVDIGVRGFVPASHVGNGRLRNIDKYVGEELQCKILEIDRERRKVVLSNRQAEEDRRVRAKEDLFTSVKPGDTLDGSVRRLTDYGAFVDLGGVDGLLHISEMSWMRINHPREMFKEGQKIQVMVLRLDKDSGKISLGHRQVLPDPWNLIKENYRGGQKLTVKINRLVQSGAFVKLPEGAEAFLPLSEMSARRVRRPQEAVDEGQEVEVQIIDLKPDERRMVLSIRALGGAPVPTSGPAPFDDDERGMKLGGKKKGKKGRGGRGRDEEDMDEFIGRRTFSSSGVTIGERLGILKGFAGREDEDAESVESVEAVEAVEDSTSVEPAVAVEDSQPSESAEPEASPTEPSEELVAAAEPEPETAEKTEA